MYTCWIIFSWKAWYMNIWSILIIRKRTFSEGVSVWHFQSPSSQALCRKSIDNSQLCKAIKIRYGNFYFQKFQQQLLVGTWNTVDPQNYRSKKNEKPYQWNILLRLYHIYEYVNWRIQVLDSPRSLFEI